MSVLTPEVQYAELIALTRRYLSQEWKGGEVLFVSEEAVDYFSAWTKPRGAPAPVTPVNRAKVTPPVQRPVPRTKPKPPPAKPKALEPTEPPPVRRETQPADHQQTDLGEMPQLVRRLFPDLPLLDGPPDDTAARAIKERWRKKDSLPAVSILVGDEEPTTFLSQIARAVDREGSPAAAVSIERIDREIGWNTFFSHRQLTRILATEETIRSHPELAPLFDEESGKLGETPLTLLPAPSGLVGSVEEKRRLWGRLKRELSL